MFVPKGMLRDKMTPHKRKVTYIPPATQNELIHNTTPLRTVGYVRVSTQEEQQLGSFEMQKKHFLEVIENNPRYHFSGLYCDEGISGTQVHNRVEFKKMMEDAKSGKIDLILTKDISRFGRNIVDILTALQTLDTLNPPVPVIFETNGIDTSDGRHNSNTFFNNIEYCYCLLPDYLKTSKDLLDTCGRISCPFLLGSTNQLTKRKIPSGKPSPA